MLPKSKYPPLELELSNLVVACAACNTAKGDWDPNKEQPLVAHDVRRLTDSQRDELVARSRRYVETKRTETERDFGKEKELILAFLRGQLAQAAGT